MTTSFPILDLILGMIFLFFLFSVITSSIVEAILAARNARASMLAEWITQIFNQPALDERGNPKPGVSLGQSLLDHCMTTTLSKPGKSTSYISAGSFVNAFLDKITLAQADQNPPTIGASGVQAVPATLAGYIAAIENSPVISGEIKRTVLALAYDAQLAYAAAQSIPAASNVLHRATSEMGHFRNRLEQWYDANTSRITDHFKRRWVMPCTAIGAGLLVLATNADSIKLAKYLYTNPEVRTGLATSALAASSDSTFVHAVMALRQAAADTTNTPADTTAAGQARVRQQITDHLNDVRTAQAALADAGSLPLFWTAADFPKGHLAASVLSKIAGLVLTFFAILMGAPFWFDLLNKIANLRGTGSKPAPAAGQPSDKE